MDKRYQNFINYLLEGMMDDKEQLDESRVINREGYDLIEDIFTYRGGLKPYNEYDVAFTTYADLEIGDENKLLKDLKSANVDCYIDDRNELDKNGFCWDRIWIKPDKNFLTYLKKCKEYYDDLMLEESRRVDREGYATRVTRYEDDETGYTVHKKYPFAKNGLSPSTDRTLTSLVEEYKKGMKDPSFDIWDYKFKVMRKLSKEFDEFKTTVKDNIVLKTLPLIQSEVYNDILASMLIDNKDAIEKHNNAMEKVDDAINLPNEEFNKFFKTFKFIEKFKQFSYTLALIRNEYTKNPQYRHNRIKPLKESDETKVYPTIINATPHPITLKIGSSEIIYPKSDVLARVKSKEKRMRGLIVVDGDKELDIDLYEYTYGDIEGLPSQKSNIFYIVSAMVLSANKESDSPRYDLIAPDTSPNGGAIREGGLVKAVTRFCV